VNSIRMKIRTDYIQVSSFNELEVEFLNIDIQEVLSQIAEIDSDVLVEYVVRNYPEEAKKALEAERESDG